jgi:hypothetical protein
VSIALRGNLKDFGMAEVFQLIGQQAKTGVLEVSGEQGSVELRFDRGHVVSATPIGGGEYAALGDMLVRCGVITREKLEELQKECASSVQTLPRVARESEAVSRADLAAIEDLLTRETIFDLLRWTGGSFHFRAESVSHERERGSLLGAEQILMDGLRMVDEWRTFAEQVPSPEVVFQRSGSFDAFRKRMQGESPRKVAVAEAVFALVDGRLPVRRVIDLSRLGSFEATRILAELRKAGCVAPLDPEQIAHARRRRLRAPLVAPLVAVRRVPALIALGLPFVLLALLLGVALLRRPARPAGPGAPLPRAPLAEARAAFETRQVRNALEAYRLARGVWPDRLDDLVSEGFLDRAALTPASGRPYYYVRHGEDFLLLPPER